MTRYFIREALLAERLFNRPPLSFAFFCATCGEVWARVWTEGEVWKVEEVPCEQHSVVGVWDWARIPGSICLLYSAGIGEAALSLETLPLPLLKRELDVHLNHYEALIWQQQQTSQ